MEVESTQKACICEEHSHSTYSMSNDAHKFHVDNLRDDYSESYEYSVMTTKINDIINHLTPFLDKCIMDSGSGGPGFSFFKFLRNYKIKRLFEKGVRDVNCEYHYISQTSFYWKNIINKVTNKEELELYDWKLYILIVIQIPNTRTINNEKYETYAKLIKKSQ